MAPVPARVQLPAGFAALSFAALSNREPLRGVGAQFDTDLFTPLGQPELATEAQLNTLRNRIRALKLGHSRIFVRALAIEPGPKGRAEREALMKTVRLAAETGVDNVNLTWWQGPYPAAERKRKMVGFAEIVSEARAQAPCVTHVTIQNEPNNQDLGHTGIPKEAMKVYRQLYMLYDEAARGMPDPVGQFPSLRKAVHVVAGDLIKLVRPNPKKADQDAWLEFIHTRMSDLVDGYSVHIYWKQGDYKGMNRRLDGLDAIRDRLDISKPLYITEYGVKGTKGLKPGTVNGTNVEETVVAAFEHAWFNALVLQKGYVGLAKWALYRTDGPKRPFGGWGMIAGPAKGCKPLPTYAATRLFTHSVPASWKPAGLIEGRDLLTSLFVSSAGDDHTVIALNRLDHQRQRVKFDNLRSNTQYICAVWNVANDGRLHAPTTVASDGDGLATVDIPPHGMIALSTRAIEV